MTAAAGRDALDTVDVAERELDLDLGGMTCASCAARIEKRLNRLDGVEAQVNYATETATVVADPSVPTDDLIGAVEAIGYTATLAAPPSDTTGGGTGERHVDEHDARLQSLRQRRIVSTLLTAPCSRWR